MCLRERRCVIVVKKEVLILREVVVEFTVPGNPVPKARARTTRNGHAYTPEKTRDYEELVKWSWVSQSKKSIEGKVPIRAYMVFYMPMPSSWSQKKREQMNGKPHLVKGDTSNICKSIEDAGNTLIYHDDSQIYSLDCKKYYSYQPRAEIKFIGEYDD